MKNIFIPVLLTVFFSAVYLDSSAQQPIDNRAVLREYANSVDSLLLKNKSISAAAASEALLKPGSPISISLEKPGKRKLSPAEIYNRSKSSTVIIGTAYKCKFCEHTHVNEASGYAIDPSGIVVTNFHVVRAFISISAENYGLAFVARTSDGKTYPIKSILTVSEENDLAIIQLELGKDKLSAFGIAEGANIGDKAYALGHPQGMHYFFSQGNVVHKEIEHFDLGKEGSYDRPVMMISADYAVGSSGGPIIDEQGNIIGTVSSTKTINHSEKSPNVQMVLKKTIPVESLWKLIVRKG